MVQVVKTRQARDDNHDSSRPSPVWRLRSGHQIRGWVCFVIGEGRKTTQSTNTVMPAMGPFPRLLDSIYAVRLPSQASVQ